MPKKKARKATKPRKKGVNGRKKGAGQELKVAKLFTEWFGAETYRTPGSGGWATRKTNKNLNASGDLVCEDPTFPFCVEVKKVEGWDLTSLFDPKQKALFFKWWKQCVDETPEDKIPLLVFNKNGTQELCAMRDKDIAGDVINNLDAVLHLTVHTHDDGLEDIMIFPLSNILRMSKEVWND